MDDKFVTAIVSVLTAIVGVAIIAVLVSNNAQTGNVITSGGNAFTNILKAAVSPVTSSSIGSINVIGNDTGVDSLDSEIYALQ